MPGIGRRLSTLVFALAIGAAAEPASAQDQWVLGAGAAFLGAGVSGIGTGDLDDRLADRGYPTFGRTAAALNIGAYQILPGGLTLGAEWHGLIIGDETHEGREVGLGGGYGTIGLGYMVEMSRRVRVYPRIGLGGGGLGLWFEDDSAAIGFDDVLAAPKPTPEPLRDPVLSRGSAVVDLGMGAELLPGGFARGLMFGLRLGYLAAPSSTSWQLHERDVSGGPSVGLGGPYLRVVVGVGRRH